MAIVRILSSTRDLFFSIHEAWSEASLLARTAAVAGPVFTITAIIYLLRPRSLPQEKVKVEPKVPKEKEGEDEGVQEKPIQVVIVDGVMEVVSVDWKALGIEEDDFSSDDEDMEWFDCKGSSDPVQSPSSLSAMDDQSVSKKPYVFKPSKDVKLHLLRFMSAADRKNLKKVSWGWEAACLKFQKQLSVERAQKFADVLCRGIGECAFSDLIYREGAVDEYVDYLEKLAAALMSRFSGYWGNNPGKFNTAIRRVRNAAEPILKALREESRSKKKPDLTPTGHRSYSKNFNKAARQLEGVAELVCLVECSERNEPQLLSMARVEHKKMVENRVHSLMRNVQVTLSSLKTRVGEWESEYPVFAPLSKLVESCLEVAEKPEVESINSLLEQVMEFNSSEVSNAIKALDGLPEKSVELAQQLARIAGALASYTSVLEKEVVPEKERGVVEGGGWKKTALGALETLLYGVLSLRNKKGTFYGLIPAARTAIQPLVYRFVIGPAIDKKIKKLAEADERFASLPLDDVKKTADELYNLAKELLTLFLNSIYDSSDHPIFNLGWDNLSELVEAAKHDDQAFFSEKALEAVELLQKGGKEQGLSHVVDALRKLIEKIIGGDVPGYKKLRKAEQDESDTEALSELQKEFQLAFLPWVLNEFADQLTAG